MSATMESKDQRIERMQTLLIPQDGGAASAVQTPEPVSTGPVRHRRRWRRDLIALDVWVVLLGGWAIAAPWALHYPGGSASSINDWACGGAVIFLSVLANAGHQRFLSWVNGLAGLVGIWLAIAVITIDGFTAAKWSDFVIGFVIFLSSTVVLNLSDPTQARFKYVRQS